MRRTLHLSVPRIVGLVACAALLVAMVVNTRFVTPDELASIGPEKFDAEQSATKLYGEAKKQLPGEATPLPELLTGLHDNVAKTAEKHDAAKPNETTYVFTVAGEATIAARQRPALELKIDGVAAQTPVTIAQGPAVNGTLLRDALGFEFGDAPNQTAYQGVGNQLKAMIQNELRKGLPDSNGSKVRFLGLLSVTDTGIPLSPRKPLSIQPVTVEAVR